MENEELELNITRFFDYFKKASESFKNIPVSDYKSLTQKLMCCCLLDTLSVARFPKENLVSKRFKDLIKTYSDYEYWDKISLPQFYYKFENCKDPKFSVLKMYIENIVSEREDYGIQSDLSSSKLISGLAIQMIEDDPTCAELIQSLPDYKMQIEQCSYLSLLYKYRNTLAHEMREPGYAFEITENEVPFYHSMTDLDENRQTFQLVYPAKFFFKICDECIQNLECYFLKQRKSPYDSFESKFGDAWK